jgi:hypothetical protein
LNDVHKVHNRNGFPLVGRVTRLSKEQSRVGVFGLACESFRFGVWKTRPDTLSLHGMTEASGGLRRAWTW